MFSTVCHDTARAITFASSRTYCASFSCFLPHALILSSLSVAPADKIEALRLICRDDPEPTPPARNRSKMWQSNPFRTIFWMSTFRLRGSRKLFGFNFPLSALSFLHHATPVVHVSDFRRISGFSIVLYLIVRPGGLEEKYGGVWREADGRIAAFPLYFALFSPSSFLMWNRFNYTSFDAFIIIIKSRAELSSVCEWNPSIAFCLDILFKLTSLPSIVVWDS